MSQLVFVYGTLKGGHARHGAMRNQRYIGIARTLPKYLMYQFGNYPALVLSDEGKNIYGELYEVDDNCILELDKIEGVDVGLFHRKEVELKDITLSQLPVNENVWSQIANKRPVGYIFKNVDKLQGARDCGEMWVVK